jgi:hypothetical protein
MVLSEMFYAWNPEMSQSIPSHQLYTPKHGELYHCMLSAPMPHERITKILNWPAS